MKTKSIILPILFLSIAHNVHAKSSKKSYSLTIPASKEKLTHLNATEINQDQKKIILEKQNIKPKKKIFKKLMIGLGSTFAVLGTVVCVATLYLISISPRILG